MEHFLIAALIVLALSPLASSKEKYLIETPDCNSCIWQWNNKAYFRFNKFVGTVCFWRHLNDVMIYLISVSDIKSNCTSLCSTVLPKRKKIPHKF